jgi:iron complex outermembrane receptor protein
LREEDLDANVTREQAIYTGVDSRSRGVFLSPRLSYKFENSDTLTFQPFIGINRNDNSSDTFIDHLGGTRPVEYARLRSGRQRTRPSCAPWASGCTRWTAAPGSTSS